MLPDLAFLLRLVRDTARSELLPRFAAVTAQTKPDGTAVTEADLVMQDRLQEALARHWPGTAFFSEEMTVAEHERLIAEGGRDLWCLDPLDGTTNYACGLPFFSVSLALLEGGRPRLAVVYDPVRDECFSATQGAGAWFNDTPLHGRRREVPPALRRCVAVVDFKRLEKHLGGALGSNPPYASQRNFGSSALEWCWLALGRFHLYLHGGQRLWDYAAGSLLLSEAGGISATLEGEPVFLMTDAPRSVVAVADQSLFDAWSGWLLHAARREGPFWNQS